MKTLWTSLVILSALFLYFLFRHFPLRSVTPIGLSLLVVGIVMFAVEIARDIQKKEFPELEDINPDYIYRYWGKSLNGSVLLSLLYIDGKPFDRQNCNLSKEQLASLEKSQKDGLYDMCNIYIWGTLQPGELCILTKVKNSSRLHLERYS